MKYQKGSRSVALEIPLAIPHVGYKRQPDKILLSVNDGLHFIPIDHIIYLRAEGSYTMFHIRDQKPVLVSGALSHYANKLESRPNFVRVHHGFMVNVNFIQKLRKDRLLQLQHVEEEIPVARRRKNKLVETLSILSI